MYRHYTNLDSLFHIVSSGKVWFSSLAFMNDELEGKELHKILSSVLQTKYDEQDYQNKLSLIETTIDTHLRFQLSFSSTVLDDDISQWRAYTKIGQGVAIEFDEDFITDSRAKKIDCLYDYESKREAIIEDVNLRSNDTRTNEILRTPEGTKRFIGSVVKTLVRFKNYSFYPERETRWVISVDGLSDRTADLKFRPHRLGITIYEAIPVDLTRVLSITLGPQVHKQNIKTIEDFLIESGCNGWIKQSGSTLRY